MAKLWFYAPYVSKKPSRLFISFSGAVAIITKYMVLILDEKIIRKRNLRMRILPLYQE